MRIRLKTKLVLAISALVFALVLALLSIYVSHIVRQRIADTYAGAEFVANQVFHASRQALEVDLSSTRVDVTNPDAVRDAIEESLQTDPGLNALLESIEGYSPTIAEVAIVGVHGKAFMHSDSSEIGKVQPQRESFANVLNGRIVRQFETVYGKPDVYEISLPLLRDGKPFAEIRVGISTLFLRYAIEPQLRQALTFSGFALLVSLVLAALLSNFALRPLEVISRRLDELTGTETHPASAGSQRSDEVSVVTGKISRLGQQIRDTREIFSALKENLDQMMANLQDGVMLFSKSGKAIMVSASAERFIGVSRGQMLGYDAAQIFCGDSQLHRVIAESFLDQQPIGGRDVLAPDGTRTQLALDFIEERGEAIGALLTMRDADSIRAIEDEIELSQRLSAIGRLTSGVAHEVKNPINAIVVHLEILRNKLQAAPPDAQRHMDVIGSEIQRLDRVVQMLVDFTRPVELRLAEVDLRKLVHEVESLAAHDAQQHGVGVTLALPNGAVSANVDADLIKQALLNVVINGIQAMPAGGELRIELVRLHTDAEIRIADQGAGIPEEVRDKIYNLYFTTKEKGSGIGLAMTYRVLQLHNGSVEFESQPDRGTTFRLRLPLLLARRTMQAETAVQQA